MLRIAYLFIISIFFTEIIFAQEEQIVIELNQEQLEHMHQEKLIYGQQSFMDLGEDSLDIGLGKTRGLLLEVPELSKDSLYIDISSFVYRHNLYYPIVIKLSRNKELQEIIQGDITITGGDVFGQSIKYLVGIDTSTHFLLVTTDPELFSTKHYFEYSDVNSGVMDAGGTMVPVNMGSYIVEDVVTITDEPKLKVMLPFKNGKPIYKRETGVYFGIGFLFGGEAVAEASEEQDFRAGGGGVFAFGYSHAIGASNVVARYSTGIRFQTGQEQRDNSFGLIGDIGLTYQTRHINFGIGGQYDFANTIKAAGETYKFKPVLSPKLLLEGRLGGYMNVGLEYIFTQFETKEKETFDGNRFGLYIRMFFGK